ncbi:3-dehydroquinate synthase [Senegalia massiliensis]|uniref:3-dehydroquinate synthase n=1 Tax=Senegalia massiliensis TaxID=1720316 RepID=UPI0013EF49FA|nr:3-dehydroquinate synthase [Senegalia massiliensis]
MKLQVDSQLYKYNIYIENNIYKTLNDYIKEYNEEKILIITDDNVRKIYLDSVLNSLKDFKVYYYIIPAGESSKSLEMAGDIYSKLLREKFDRQSLIIGFGGGVVGDLAGFVAATYMRGINLIQIPTTLLSQVDSSIGGKVGVNFNNIKNIIGSFYQPKKVIIDIDTLKTLSERDTKSGLAEIIKYGIISDYKLLDIIHNINNIRNMDFKLIKLLIKRSLEIKKDIVKVDTFEKGKRKILNFGHTIGHGIESLDNFKRFKHGEAVALGMLSEAYISKELGFISTKYYQEIKQLVKKITQDNIFTQQEKQVIMENIKLDKKNMNENIVFILPISYGKVKIYENKIDEELIKKSLGEDI